MARKTLPKAIARKVQRFARHVQAHNIPVTGVYVFGSYAKGTPCAHSDIDVCITSPLFVDHFDALATLWQLRESEHIPIEPIGMTTADLTEETTLTNEIRRYGIPVAV